MPKPSPPADPSNAIQEEALAVARSIQKPGQTKEQTRQIAQGIAKGIELYKRQQSAKARERDKFRKRLEKARRISALGANSQIADTDPDSLSPSAPPTAALTVCGMLLLTMAILHVIRVYAGWTLVIGTWASPLWISALAAALLGALACWILLTAYQSR